MKKLFINSLAWFLAAVVLCLPAFTKSNRYNTAIENGYEIEAVVVDYDKKIQSVEHTTDSEVFILYVNYEVDGKEYKDIKAGEYAEFHSIGDTIKIVVNPNNPREILQDSDMFTGILSIAGVFIAIFGIVTEIRTMKKNKAAKEDN